jgi:hypothetical protein
VLEARYSSVVKRIRVSGGKPLLPTFKVCVGMALGHAVAQWLRHCGTNRKVAGSIPDGVIGPDILPAALWSWRRLNL